MRMIKTINKYIAFQFKEVEEHKYYLSQSVGYDVGYEHALRDWVNSGHAKRFWDTYNQNKDTIESFCNSCNKCTNALDCCIPNDLVHRLMDD
jgi:hypothetical protein